MKNNNFIKQLAGLELKKLENLKIDKDLEHINFP